MFKTIGGELAMKRIAHWGLCLATIALVLSSDYAQAEPKSYPLMCRGGGVMKGIFSVWDIKVDFIGAKQGAAVRLPQPGECAWLDRGFRSGEPQKFRWAAKRKMLLQAFFESQDVKKILSSSQNFNYLAKGILNGEVFQVHAYRGQCPGKKCNILTVTKVN